MVKNKRSAKGKVKSMRGGFISPSFTKKVSQDTMKYVEGKMRESLTNGLRKGVDHTFETMPRKVTTTLNALKNIDTKNGKLSTALSIGETALGLASGMLPTLSVKMEKSLSSVPGTFLGRKKTVKFITGTPPTRSLKALAKQNGTKTVIFEDTRHIGGESTFNQTRARLTADFGFNTKGMITPLPLSTFVYGNLVPIFEGLNSATLPPQNSDYSAYLGLIKTMTRHTLSNGNSYFPINVRILLCKFKNTTAKIEDIYENVFTRVIADPSDDERRKSIPTRFQQQNTTLDLDPDYFQHAECTPTASWGMSGWFKENV